MTRITTNMDRGDLNSGCQKGELQQTLIYIDVEERLLIRSSVVHSAGHVYLFFLIHVFCFRYFLTFGQYGYWFIERKYWLIRPIP